jgi:NAD-dependent dihydropyrimidine dehydrogenase PreA subunit
MPFKVRQDIPRTTTFAYRKAPRSGNLINGLGETEWRRASHVFHNDGNDELPWDGLDGLFAYVNDWRVVLWIMRNIWRLRRSTGRPAREQKPIVDPSAMTREIEALARRLGADLVGVTTMKPGYVDEGHQVPYENVISIGISMDRGRMMGVPDSASAVEVMRAYAELGRVTSALAEEIRGWGWPARAYGNPNSGDLLHIPVAIDCGFGQLGKHGSLISKEHGSNFRLGCVVTDLPLAVTPGPVDIGVEDLCARCNLCVRDCPVEAIFPEKQTVRGVQKWYVDFDRCVYYFCETSGCGICIEVCPWSEEGRGPWLSDRLLQVRHTRARSNTFTGWDLA